MAEALTRINRVVQPVLWGWPVLLLILLVGILYTVKLKAFQLTHFALWMRCTVGSLVRKKQAGERGITPFQSVTTALAGSIGTGNIVGVATALTLGGPGAIFWMWISAVFGMATIYGETVLGMKYRAKDQNGRWTGGAMYYLEKGVGKRWMAHLFAGACALAALGMGNMTQSNAIGAAIFDGLGVPKVWAGLLIAVLLALILTGGIRRIAKVTESVVPFFSLFYLAVGTLVLALNWEQILPSFAQIFKGAFTLKSALGGAGGYGIARAMEIGLSRGIFTNEAGLGSSVTAHAAADTTEPCEQGMWAIFQVFLDTIVVCTLTALCILSTGVLSSGLDGGALSGASFAQSLGKPGAVFLTVSIVFFAFATMLGWSYYGECAVRYLCLNSPFLSRHWSVVLVCYRILYAAAAVAGASMDLYVVWDLCGSCNGLMALPNLYGLFRLSPVVKTETEAYLNRKKGQKKTVPGGGNGCAVDRRLL